MLNLCITFWQAGHLMSIQLATITIYHHLCYTSSGIVWFSFPLFIILNISSHKSQLVKSWQLQIKKQIIENCWLLANFNSNTFGLHIALHWDFIFYWSASTKPGNWAVMYLCVKGIHFASFYDFLLDFGTVRTVIFFVFHLIAFSLVI